MAAPGVEGQTRGARNRAFTHFESFESAVENTAGDPRDLNGNGVIDCGEDNDCATITPCDQNPRRCDEWTLPLVSEPDLQFANEDAAGNKISFKSGAGPFFPDGRGTIEVVGPGSKEVCPGDPPIQGGIFPDRLDWHIHTLRTPDIDDRLIGAPGSLPKAFRGQNSLHWGRHVRVPNRPESQKAFGDTYCVQCMNAYVLDRPGGLQLNRRPTSGQPLRLSFWHIAEFANGEIYGAFQLDTAVDVGIVEVRAAEPGSDQFGVWERVVPDLNGYDGTRDTFYTTPTYEPPDDVNPADPTDPLTTTCFPLTVYVSQGSAKGTDPGCGDGDLNGFSDCGNVTSGTARGEAGAGVWARTEVDLRRYAGKRIQIRFLATTQDGVGIFTSYLETTRSTSRYTEGLEAASGDDGWYIDDIRVSGLAR